MKPQLFSIESAPASLPIWQTILDDLCNPPVPRVARVLGVGQRTVYRWNQTGCAPRVAQLALFWLTRWGRSEVNARAVNDAALYFALARARADDVQRLELEVRRLAAVAGLGSSDLVLVGGSGRG